MKKIVIIILMLLTGCTSISNLKEVDFGITGLEMEFYESAPSHKDITIFDHRANIDKIYKEKTQSSKLMPLRKK